MAGSGRDFTMPDVSPVSLRISRIVDPHVTESQVKQGKKNLTAKVEGGLKKLTNFQVFLCHIVCSFSHNFAVFKKGVFFCL